MFSQLAQSSIKAMF
ncbi:TPA: hypothetical protein RVT71_001213 [Escherichia coli]|nr:hypothetical protein [Escherichia coli]